MVCVAFCRPEIPQNVGAILRICACFDVKAEFIGPFSFLWSDKYLNRSAMDYKKIAEYEIRPSWGEFIKRRGKGRIIATAARKGIAYHEFKFENSDTLLLGSESVGLGELEISYSDSIVNVPISQRARSLNVHVCAAIVLSEALRQTDALPHPSS
ncbi:TrmH family RNA methyltransferase [Candidatus Hydrogenosomobacter endosymbioticus]|uniref:tRNA (cytidine(34)-2'-O)-methyltransferase n=1 Tax=Candidatus Hydrogenosomobacter endosymbioticus TaxID=2558174 RepID=A0ABN6L2A4_9PROT|nr:TrmH family RNA methyltransferase [Candidatus Hydrogenosomobacter endosymbioticus]BDB95976.1 tRNA (cytidine(34)-2'-O)-methyltransferase [Candidatus Hydrogenosomobacter endosymbioticus]